MNTASDECLLTYLPSTYPTPLQVSTSQTPITGLLNTAALNESTGEVYCNEILIAVPVGPDPGGLFAHRRRRAPPATPPSGPSPAWCSSQAASSGLTTILNTRFSLSTAALKVII